MKRLIPRRYKLATMLAATLLALGSSPQPANAQSPPQADGADTAPSGPVTQRPLLILFDASGSMWGTLQGSNQPKFALAREALRQHLARQNASDRIPRESGMIVFGRSCQAAGLSSPLARQSTGSLLSPLDDLNPRGKGPIALALEQAGRTLAPGSSADLVLVLDGADNCGGDVCAATRTILARNPGTRIHLLSMGLGTQDARATDCIAKLTNGRIFANDDALDVEDSAARIIALLDSPASDPQPPEAGASTPSAAAPGAGDKTGPARIRALATLGQGGPPIERKLFWQIRPLAEDGTRREPVLERDARQLAAKLAPGRYELSATVSVLSATREVEIAAKGATITKLPLNAGLLTLSAPEPILNDRSITLTLTPVADLQDASSTTTGSQTSADQPLIATLQGDPLLVPAGTFWMTAIGDSLKDERKITVEAGSKREHQIFEDYGSLIIDLNSAASAKPDVAVTISIEIDDPGSPGGRRVVTRSTAPRAAFHLPAGTYYLNALLGSRRTAQLIALGAGDVQRRAFGLQVATLTVRTAIPPAVLDRAGTAPLTYQVFDLTAPGRPEVGWSGANEATFTLPPGRYEVVSQIGAHNALGKQVVSLSAGQKESLAIPASAARVILELDGAASETYRNRLWEVRTSDGGLVWRTNQSRPSTLLAPGAYVVRCFLGTRILEGSFTVDNATAQTVTLLAES